MTIKVAIEGSFNLDLLRDPLAEAWRRAGLDAEIAIGPYSQYAQRMLDPASALHRFAPELLILVPHWKDVLAELDRAPLEILLDEAKARAMGEGAFRALRELIEAFLARAPGAVVFSANLAVPRLGVLGDLPANAGAGLDEAVSRFNIELARWAAAQDRAFVLDAEDIVRGMGERQAYDPRMWYLARTPWSRAFFRELAGRSARMWRALHGQMRKCLCLDLDNTLWGGIVGEDGVGGLQLGGEGVGFAFKEFQMAIEQLRHRGVLIALNSKNNLDDAREAFDKHPEMALRWDDLAAVRVNWMDKAANMAELAAELNIGLDAFVFLDDNPVEREAMRQALPQVAVPDFPKDPSELVGWFTALCHEHFNALRLTREDLAKSDQYRARRQVEDVKSRTGSVEEFLASLEMTAVIRPLTRETLPRVAQLTLKTNQFNLTTRRYTEAELERMAKQPDTFIYSLQLRDKFADNGIVAVTIITPLDAEKYNVDLGVRKTFLIDTFLMSCRVIGRGIEGAFLNWVAARLHARYGECSLIGEYIPTKKNGQVEKLYETLSFESCEISSGKCLWKNSTKMIAEYTTSPMDMTYEE